MPARFSTPSSSSQPELHQYEKRQSCYYDRFGRYQCSGVSNGARIGVGIGIAVAVLLLITAILAIGRRRRRRNANITTPMYATSATAPASQYQQGYYPQQQQTGYGGQPQQGYNTSNAYSPGGFNVGGAGGNPYASGGRDADSAAYPPPSGPPPSGDGYKPSEGQYAPPPTAPPPAYGGEGHSKV